MVPTRSFALMVMICVQTVKSVRVVFCAGKVSVLFPSMVTVKGVVGSLRSTFSGTVPG